MDSAANPYPIRNSSYLPNYPYSQWDASSRRHHSSGHHSHHTSGHHSDDHHSHHTRRRHSDEHQPHHTNRHSGSRESSAQAVPLADRRRRSSSASRRSPPDREHLHVPSNRGDLQTIQSSSSKPASIQTNRSKVSNESIQTSRSKASNWSTQSVVTNDTHRTKLSYRVEKLETEVVSTRTNRFSSMIRAPTNKFEPHALAKKQYSLYHESQHQIVISNNVNATTMYTALLCSGKRRPQTQD